ncbi:MAG TPA: hypothetical protein PKD90_04450 [Phnomibacter sp.]|nr:hypothetical protein [Phnomibacter sp.]
MARSINDIQASIIAAKDGDPTLAALNSTSRTAIWRLLTYVVAAAIWVLETLFDTHKAEVLETVANLKPHSLRWYALAARRYRHGQALIPETDKYSDEGLTSAQILAMQVVSYAAVVEQPLGLRIKVATMGVSDLEPLGNEQMLGFVEYMNYIKDAGVRLLITTGPPDSLRLSLVIYYNPLVLNANGARLDGANNTPVKAAIKQYLQNLPFNGILVLAYLVDALQAVDGVVVPHIVAASASYGSLPYTPFSVEYQPDAGYMRIVQPGDIQIAYLPKTPF